MVKRHHKPIAPDLPPLARVINDEEPSPDAMERLWMALDAALDPDPPGRTTAATLQSHRGSHWCCRCGYSWTPRNPDPRCCPLCRSAYWDRAPQRSTAHSPADTDWEALAVQRRQGAETRRQFRHLAKVKQLAAELGFDITDPRNGQVVSKRRVTRTTAMEPVTTREELAPEMVPAQVVPLQFRRTVPPPPGIEDLK